LAGGEAADGSGRVIDPVNPTDRNWHVAVEHCGYQLLEGLSGGVGGDSGGVNAAPAEPVRAESNSRNRPADRNEQVPEGHAAATKVAKAAAYGHLMLIGPAMAGYFSTPSQMPGAVVEPLYVTDPFEGTLAASATGHMAIAKGIASAVEQFLTPPPSPKTASTS
jgi:hypothetical protein